MESKSASLIELESLLTKNLHSGSSTVSDTVDGVTTTTRTVNITPKLAEALLTRNISNRPITKANVLKLELAMNNGEWVFDGTPITFDKHGNLLNGQHRLTAVVKSNKTNVFKVNTGFNSTIFTTMDIGKTRTGADVLAIAGVSDYTLCAQMANFIFKFTMGSISESAVKSSRNSARPNQALTHPELVKFVSTKPQLSVSVEFAKALKKKMAISLMPVYMIGGLHFIFTTKDETDANDFMDKLATGEGLSIDSPIYHLRNRLLNSKVDKSKRLLHNEIVKLVVISWNKYRNKEKIKALKIPEILPKVI